MRPLGFPRVLLRALLFAAGLSLVGTRAPLATAGGPPIEPPAPPAKGPGSALTPYARAVETTVPNPADPARKVHLFRPEGPPAGTAPPERLPVVVFAHGFGAGGPEPYQAWLEHVAREGTLVVYPVYPGLEGGPRPSRYDVLWAGIEAGLAAFAAGDGPKPDVKRMGFLGHSFGGGAVPALAARAAARGYAADALWIECFAPWYDLDRAAWASIPSSALLLTVAYCDDKVCDPSMAASFIAAASTLPADRKALVVFKTDAHGTPALKADHLAPLTMRGVDALDTWGTWRLDDALRAYALTGAAEAKAIAFGTDPAVRSLGTWSDGAAATVPAVGALPSEARQTGLRWILGGLAEEFGRKLGKEEPYSALALPPPERVPASRLRSRSGWRAAPSPLPPEIAAAAAKGPLLVEVVEKPKGATVTALDAAAEAFRAKGIEVLRVPRDSPLAQALGVEADPSVLLFAKGGLLRLWKEGEETNLVPAILDLSK